MKKLPIILVAALCSLALPVLAEDTNALKTALGVFDAQTGTLIIKGYDLIGSLYAGADVITVRCKESTEVNTGHKADGLAIELVENSQRPERILVDYDEIDSLLGSMDYLNKISDVVTPLPSFEANYTTKAGLRVIADRPRKDAGIKMFLEYGDHPRILMSPVQWVQFCTLIQQGKTNLDSLRNPK